MTSVAYSAASLENGDVLDAEEFLRRYEACEDLEHVELIEGIVYMPSPVSFDRHGRPQTLMLAWLLAYERLHPDEVIAGSPSTVVLDAKNVPEPDGVLYRRERVVLNDRHLLELPPDLIVEIANSSVSRDLNQKKEAYRRNGVQEYVVWRIGDETIDWFELDNGQYRLKQPKDGVIESARFPGLRLNLAAALAHDLRGIEQAVT